MLCVPLAFTSIIIAFQINPRADHEPNVSKPIIMHAGNSFLFLLIIFLVRLVHQQSLGKVQIEFVPEKNEKTKISYVLHSMSIYHWVLTILGSIEKQ